MIEVTYRLTRVYWCPNYFTMCISSKSFNTPHGGGQYLVVAICNSAMCADSKASLPIFAILIAFEQ